MNFPTFIIVVLIIIIAVLARALRRAHREEEETKMQKNLGRIMSLFETDRELTNTEIRKALGVSSRTVVRYMDELEMAGKVIQVGKTGYNVTYKRS